MTDWRSRATCRRLNPDDYDTGADGNRFVMLLCNQVCPVRAQCAAADPAPVGVIRAGIAYTNTGDKAAICGCGQPIHPPRVASTMCRRCDPPLDTPMPRYRQTRRARHGEVARHADTIVDLKGRGFSDRAIALRLGCSATAVRGVRRLHVVREAS